MPDEAEVIGLLALMLATHARQAARADAAGDLVLIADQDRSRWDHAAIAEAAALVESVLRRGRTGPYQVQAAIACLHGLAPTYGETDWPQIAELYAMLERPRPTPVVRVNRAVAVVDGGRPARRRWLCSTVSTGTSIERWHLYWATRADLYRRLDDHVLAAEAYRQALACAPERHRAPVSRGSLARLGAGLRS